MALKTKSISANGSYGHHKLTLTVNEDSTNTANNTSSISYKFVLSPIQKSWDWYYASNSDIVTYTITINGTKYTGNIPEYDGSSTVTVKSGSGISVAHSSNGSKTISFSFSVTSRSGVTYVIGSASASGSLELTKIPRAATLSSAPNFNDEQNPTITYSNPAGSAVTSLQACIADSTGKNAIIAYRDINKTGTSYTFPLTEAERKVLRKQVTSGSTATIKFYVKTVIGGETFYSSTSKTLTLINHIPTLNPVVFDGGSVSKTLTGNLNTMIKYFNSMEAYHGAVARKEATISAIKIINGSTTLYGDGYFPNTSSNTFEFRVSDSRGNTVTQTITLPMVEYVPLTCNVDGKIVLDTEDSTKANITFTVKGNYFNGSFGAVSNTLGLFYKLVDDGGNIVLSELLPIPSSAISGTKYEVTYTVPLKVDYKSNFTIEAYACDEIYKDVQATSKTLRATPVFDWSGDDFNFNVPISINNNPMADFIVEQGTKTTGSGNSTAHWTYRKWNSGVAECWTRKHISTAVNTAWGNIYVSGPLSYTNITWGVDFVALPIANITIAPDASGAFLIASGSTELTETNTGGYEIARGAALSSTASFYINYYGIGKWK